MFAEQRFDRVGLRLDRGSVRPVVGSPGMIDVWGVATRSGIFAYEDANGGALLELRPRDQVFDAASLATLRGVPFTIDHPDSEVTSSNVRELAHGWVLDVRPEGDLVKVNVRLCSDEVQNKIADGKVELSCGYTAFVDPTPGVTANGERYDAVQTSIKYNHLALVDAARAGPVARLHLDGKSRQQVARRRPMQIKHDGKTYSLPPFLRSAVEAAAVREDVGVATGRVTIETEEGMSELVLPMSIIEQILGSLGAVPAAAPASTEIVEGEDAAPKKDALAALVAAQVKAQLARADQAARERADVERRASRILGDSYAYAQHDTWTIAAEAIGHVDEAAKPGVQALAANARRGDERAAGALLAHLDLALKQHAAHQDSSGSLMNNVFAARSTGDQSPTSNLSPSEAARERMIARLDGGRKPAPQAAK